MDAKEIRRNVTIVIGCVLLLCGGSFAGGYAFCQRQYQPDSRRLDEYGRQMGLVRGAVETVYEGLGDIQESVASITNIIGSDAKDLRGYAAQLRTIAAEVKVLEDSVNNTRRSVDSITDSINSEKVDD